MKLFGYILAFYIITLSVVPSCSLDGCLDDKTEQNSRHDQQDSDCGNCSPFFTCSGCMISAFTIDLLNLQSTPSISIKTYTGYIESSVPDMHYDFWQPPKIG
jgi:sulfatase maturation enzyme AslB (radical SAM superfamily)